MKSEVMKCLLKQLQETLGCWIELLETRYTTKEGKEMVGSA